MKEFRKGNCINLVLMILFLMSFGGCFTQKQEEKNQDLQQEQTKISSSKVKKRTFESGITIFYKTNWTNSYLHYNADGKGWTTLPGITFESTNYFTGYKQITITAQALEFVLNDGNNHWDNPIGGGNYHINSPGIYRIENGVVYSATSDKIEIYYKTSWIDTNIHFKTNTRDWTISPGVKMIDGQNGYKYAAINGLNAEFVFNNNSGVWDNNSNLNYKITNTGIYIIENGLITKKPDAPKNITADFITNSGIKVSWDISEGAKNYKVYKSEEENGTYSEIYDTAKEIKVNYLTTWNANIHYSADGGAWTLLPGISMSNSLDYSGYKYAKITASSLDFVFNDGNNHWDNKPGGGNYHIGVGGEYKVENGIISSIVKNRYEFIDSNAVEGKRSYYKVQAIRDSLISDFSVIKKVDLRTDFTEDKFDITYGTNGITIKAKESFFIVEFELNEPASTSSGIVFTKGNGREFINNDNDDEKNIFGIMAGIKGNGKTFDAGETILTITGAKPSSRVKMRLYYRTESEIPTSLATQQIVQSVMLISTYASEVSSVATPKLLGDFNNDGEVNVVDFAALKYVYGEPAKYSSIYDIYPATKGTSTGWTDIYAKATPDGFIKIADVVVFAINYGKTPKVPDSIVVSSNKNSILLNGEDEVVLAAIVKDKNGNNITGDDVLFSESDKILVNNRFKANTSDTSTPFSFKANISQVVSTPISIPKKIVTKEKLYEFDKTYAGEVKYTTEYINDIKINIKSTYNKDGTQIKTTYYKDDWTPTKAVIYNDDGTISESYSYLYDTSINNLIKTVEVSDQNNNKIGYYSYLYNNNHLENIKYYQDNVIQFELSNTYDDFGNLLYSRESCLGKEIGYWKSIYNSNRFEYRTEYYTTDNILKLYKEYPIEGNYTNYNICNETGTVLESHESITQ